LARQRRYTEEEEESMNDMSPAEITWQFMLIAKSPTQVDAAGSATKLVFTDTSEVSWIRLLAKDRLIEIIDDHGFVGIQGLTAKGKRDGVRPLPSGSAT
jgi:hypothetical protein